MGAARGVESFDGCPVSRLPLYSHNDYRSAHPLTDALQAGFRGVEVDLFLADGVLRAGHSKREARRGPSFEKQYVEPLTLLLANCERLTPTGSVPFLLFIEIKEAAPAVYDSIVATLARHPTLRARRDGRADRAIETILVGWTPDTVQLRDPKREVLPRQFRMHHAADTLVGALQSSVSLISIDYGKTIGRWWRRELTRRRWYEAIGIVKRRYPDRLVRVHNVPPDSAVIVRLLKAGADVIGATDVNRFGRLLEHRVAVPGS